MKVYSLSLILQLIYLYSQSQTQGTSQFIASIYDAGGRISFFTGDNNLGFFAGYNDGVSCYYNSSSDAISYVDKVIGEGYAIKSMAFTSKGDGWVIIYGTNMAWSKNIPPEMHEDIKALNENGTEISFVQFTNSDGWVILYDNGTKSTYRRFPTDVANAIKEKQQGGYPVKSISFTPSGGWVMVYGLNGWQSSNAPENCAEELRDLNDDHKEIYSVSITEFSEYVILYDGGIRYNFLDDGAAETYLNSLSEYVPWHDLDIKNLEIPGGKVLLPCANATGNNILSIEKVFIRSNGENSFRGAAALGISTFVSNDAENWYLYSNVPLIGLHNEGAEEKGECKGYAKLEWYSNEAIQYYNYGLLDWDAFPNYSYIRFVITEGDHEHDPKFAILGGLAKYSPIRWIPNIRSAFIDDIIFDVYTSVRDLKRGMVAKLEGTHSGDATVWLRTKRCN
jgi:hypothetical protein